MSYLFAYFFVYFLDGLCCVQDRSVDEAFCFRFAVEYVLFFQFHEENNTISCQHGRTSDSCSTLRYMQLMPWTPSLRAARYVIYTQ